MTLEEALAGKEIPEEIPTTLVIIDIDYLNFEDVSQSGQLVVHRELAAEVRDIFSEIVAMRFPIAKMLPVVAYAWSDDASMADNNCSAFNYRAAVGRTTLSKHAYGRAIDINPVQNPYVKGELVLPPGAVYSPAVRGTLLGDEPVVAAFENRGWTWGGRWNSLKDWHHFEKT